MDFSTSPVHRRHGTSRPTYEAANSSGPLSGPRRVRHNGPLQDGRLPQGKSVSTIFHAAAFTSPPRLTRTRSWRWTSTSSAPRTWFAFAWNETFKLLYISTDYVFKGDSGMYKEDDPVLPANKYAWSKLGGECAVRMYDNSLIVRTSFGDTVFPYEKAFVDQWTSRLRVDVLAKKLDQAAWRAT